MNATTVDRSRPRICATRGERYSYGPADASRPTRASGSRCDPRSAAAVGPRLVNSNRAQLTIGAGLAFNDERGVDVEPTQNIEALITFKNSFYTYDRPKTNFDISFDYYPSLSNRGRQRVQLDASVKREFFKDLFLSFNLYNSYDNRPPNPEANTNDVGFVLSIGWSY